MNPNLNTPIHLNHQHLGLGSPLVILHGLFGNGTNWRSTARRLSECRKIYLPDARNHGTSDHAPSMDYLTLAQDALNFMDRQGLNDADIMGHSMGGKTAMHLALAAPERVRSLLIVDIAPEVSPSDHLPLIEAMQALPLDQIKQRREADEALSISVSDAGLRAFLLQNLITENNQLSWRIDLTAIRSAMPDLLDFPSPPRQAQYSGSVLFLRGQRSNYVLDKSESSIKALFPKAKIQTIANAGHWPHAEQPEEFTNAVKTFLGCKD